MKGKEGGGDGAGPVVLKGGSEKVDSTSPAKGCHFSPERLLNGGGAAFRVRGERNGEKKGEGGCAWEHQTQSHRGERRRIKKEEKRG